MTTEPIFEPEPACTKIRSANENCVKTQGGMLTFKSVGYCKSNTYRGLVLLEAVGQRYSRSSKFNLI